MCPHIKRTTWDLFSRKFARAAAFALSVLCLLGGGSREAAAQYSQQGAKLVAPDAVGNASQGYSVAVSADGNTMIVGGISDNSGDGAAWVYTRSGGVWTEQAKLLPSDAANPAEFGYSVALSADGNTALVGGQGDNSLDGAAWVFTRSGGVWTQQGSKLVGTPGGGQEGFSVALSADGNTAIVGGPEDNGNVGAAWVFTRSGGVWSQQAKLVGTGYVNFESDGILQGWSVALSGDGNTAAVGGPADNRVGATWIFTRSGGVWSQQGAKLAAAGNSVALSGGVGNILLVGVNAGATASVFVRNGGVWAQFAEFTGTPTTGGPIGPSVALSADGNTALLGGYGDNTNVGAAWIFTFNDGVWTQNGSKLVASDESAEGSFGYGVALSADGSTAIIGGPGDNSGAGAAWAFVAAPPTVTALSPAIGTAAGGTSVTITGTNFLGAAAVQFGSANATSFTIASATSITAVSPAGGGTVDVTVTNAGGASATSTADQFTYIGASTPTVTAIAPSSGPPAGGTRVTISGSGFNGTSAVQFGYTSAASFTVNNNNRITATSPPFTPPSSDTVDVTVTVGSLTSATSAADQFTYGVAPAVTSVAPDSGSAAGGTAVTITGTNFTGATAVSFGGVAATAFNVVSATSITATSPAGSGTVDVTVTTPAGTSSTGAADGFTYIAGPTVTSISPPSGPAAGGTIVTIGGTGFTGVTAVKFGGTSAVWFNVETATTINAKAPAGIGTVDVTVSTGGGTSATGAADKFVFDPPTNRSWVSAAAGSDLNPCTVTLPCRTFSGAYANTLAGGEIDVLSPGDYGPLTVTHALSIYNDGAGAAGALTTAGTSGITVNAGSNDDVNLRGLSFNGFTASGASGVVFNSGAQLHIDKCTFQDFATSGITFAPGAGSAATAAMVVENTTLIANTIGMAIKPTGGIAANVALRRIKLDKNTGGGLSVDGTGGSGAISTSLADSSASLNAGNGITATGGTGGVTLNMMRVVAASNGAVGIQSSQSDGGTATVTVGKSTVYGNAVGVQSLDGGALLSYANTQLTGNTSNGSFTGSASLQ